MQPLIKYYNLESRSWEEVSELEQNLKKYLLNQNNVKGLLQAPVEAVADAYLGNTDAETLDRVIYDSGEFDVLYKKSKEISPRKKGKRRWFRANDPDTPERVGVELVVKANPYDIVQLQEYLTQSGIDVVEARRIYLAIFNFWSHPSHPDFIENSKVILQGLLNKNYDEVEMQLTSIKDTQYLMDGKNKKGNMLQGILRGPVQKILELRDVTKSITSLVHENINFLK